MWQDVAIAAANVVFILSTIPAFRQPPHVVTCGLIVLSLSVFTVVYISLHLIAAGGTTAIETLSWAALTGAAWIKRGEHAESSQKQATSTTN